ncbi:VWA domain-containing protein, partial [candidate division KSB1 bacterium]|nr:VWA domain-containing protein [candidate division KSB1 bacterium]NIR70436.1 VWA domain-containing protein [candidate division KSB1 bacterium]NIS23166.1 VWA domain-containing protein [candidate division KSB1 bacterium]NIT70025.1 VWA domain-containing protein [candidate division KSB1 bacterium]NIU23663.1 VWA domain-containing protein [candidate division KSB1 bacterium]
MLEFLLKYSPVVFKEGNLTIKFLPSVLTLLGLALVIGLVLWLVYRKTTLRIKRPLKIAFIGLKFLVIALLLFALFEPVITISSVIPRKSSLLVLVDDSRSMSIEDAGNKRSRTGFARTLLGDGTNPGLLAKLEQNFKIQTYKFASEVQHIKDCNNLAAQGAASNLGRSLNFVAELGNQGLVAGVVLLTDGADNGDTDPLETADLLQSKNLPIYAVGIGSEQSEDIELAKVAANHSVIENSVVEISALIKNKMFDSKEVELELREEGAIVKKQTEQLRGAATR